MENPTSNENSSDVEPLIGDTLQGAIVGGILGFASSIGVDYLKIGLIDQRFQLTRKFTWLHLIILA